MAMKPCIVLVLMLISPLAWAKLDLITWKGTYYQAMPNKKGISQQYCEEHTPGSFVHVVKDALARPVFTDRGIKLDRATFKLNHVRGVYLITGDFWATGQSNHVTWQDHIYYHLYKLTESGETRGVWSTNECKGLYVGVVVRNKNPSSTA